MHLNKTRMIHIFIIIFIFSLTVVALMIGLIVYQETQTQATMRSSVANIKRNIMYRNDAFSQNEVMDYATKQAVDDEKEFFRKYSCLYLTMDDLIRNMFIVRRKLSIKDLLDNYRYLREHGLINDKYYITNVNKTLTALYRLYNPYSKIRFRTYRMSGINMLNELTYGDVLSSIYILKYKNSTNHYTYRLYITRNNFLEYNSNNMLSEYRLIQLIKVVVSK